MALSQVASQLTTYDASPSMLLKEEGSEAAFMKEWLCSFPSQQLKKQYCYVWTLFNEWQLQQLLPSSLITTSSKISNQILLNKPQTLKIGKLDVNLFMKQSNAVQYLSKSELVIKFKNNLIWINPSSPFSAIQTHRHALIVVLTSANINQIFHFIEFHLINKVRLITTEVIYRKIKHLCAFLQPIHAFSLPQTYFLTPDEYFQYGNIMWLMRQNCWMEPSYDLQISFPHSRQRFLVQNFKLDQTKLIYYGWKKGQISEANYQKYIREWERDITKASAQMFLVPDLPLAKFEKKDWYLSFVEKELISTLSYHEQDQLFACCEVIELIPNQIIAKRTYRFDYLYLLLEGEFQLRDPQQSAPSQRLYGLEQLKAGQDAYRFTLATVTHGRVLRIGRDDVLFHLYDLLH